MLEKDLLVIEAIYDALFQQEGWGPAMECVGQSFHSNSVGFFEYNFAAPAEIQHHMLGIEEAQMEDYEAYYSHIHPVFTAENFAAPGKLVGDHYLESFANDHKIWTGSELFNDWLRKMDMRHSIGITLESNNDRFLNFTLIRPEKIGYYTHEEEQRFQNITRHLNQALTLQRKIDSLELRAEASESALSRLDVGILNLTNQGKIQFMNPYAARTVYSQQGLGDQEGYLVALASTTANVILQKAIFTCGTTRRTEIVDIPGCTGGRLSLTIMPNQERKQLLGHFDQGLTILFDHQDHTCFSAQLMHRFQLTLAEAELAIAFAEGHTLQQISEKFDKSIHTVRTQMKAIYQKTGVNKQAKLVSLIKNLAPSKNSLNQKPII